jgi:hypothetical protein
LSSTMTVLLMSNPSSSKNLLPATAAKLHTYGGLNAVVI